MAIWKDFTLLTIEKLANQLIVQTITVLVIPKVYIVDKILSTLNWCCEECSTVPDKRNVSITRSEDFNNVCLIYHVHIQAVHSWFVYIS